MSLWLIGDVVLRICLAQEHFMISKNESDQSDHAEFEIRFERSASVGLFPLYGAQRLGSVSKRFLFFSIYLR